jgi:hypothetical protein
MKATDPSRFKRDADGSLIDFYLNQKTDPSGYTVRLNLSPSYYEKELERGTMQTQPQTQTQSQTHQVSKRRAAILGVAEVAFLQAVSKHPRFGDLSLALGYYLGVWGKVIATETDMPLSQKDGLLLLPLGMVVLELLERSPDARADIDKERERQEAKWGDQRHKPRRTWARILLEEIGEWAKEELEGNAEAAYVELVQVAAVLCQIAEIALFEKSTDTLLTALGDAWDGI